jgi:hypothetical protein
MCQNYIFRLKEKEEVFVENCFNFCVYKQAETGHLGISFIDFIYYFFREYTVK